MPKTKVNTQRKKTNANTGNTDLKDYIKIQLISLAVYAAVFIFASVICLTFDTNDNLDFYISLSAVAAASFVSGFLGGNKTRKNGIVSGLIYSLPSNVIVIFVSLASSAFKADFRLLITALILIAAGVVGGITAVNKRHRR